jgi:transcriptional regulator with GAF, ATPase, and Fis domain
MDDQYFFRETTLRICGSLELEKALWNALKFIKDFIPAEKVFLVRYIPELKGVRILVEADRDAGRPLNIVTPLSDEARALIEGDAIPLIYTSRVESDPIMKHVIEVVEGTHSEFVTLRMILDGKSLGALIFRAVAGKKFSKADMELLSSLREPFAIALHNCSTFRELQQLKETLVDDNQYLRGEIQERISGSIIGSEFGLKAVMEMVNLVAPLNSPVLLLGETGVGKEIIAAAIHNLSLKREEPFVKVNCGAIPETLVDSELFGHEKGAFTGALSQKRGRFERAHGGTIFLDEIGELPLEAQVRLLRVLQEKEIERVGGSKPVNVDIRVIIATHRDLETMVNEGRFRDDLYFRLKVFPITIPPLRERLGDIPALVHHFLIKKSREMGLSGIPTLTPGAMDRLMGYRWPGNVRELENTVERALILGKGEPLTLEDLHNPLKEDTNSSPLPHDEKTLDINLVMTRHIQHVLEMTGGRIEGKRGAALLLNINPATLRARMRKLGIPFGRKVKQRLEDELQ